jgi:hypothetical protein
MLDFFLLFFSGSIRYTPTFIIEPMETPDGAALSCSVFDIMLSAERAAIPALAENQGGMFTKSGNVFYCLTTVIMDAARLMVTTRANMRFSGQLDENFRFIRQLPHIFYDYPF